jgi:ribosome-associated translation inhibitor RaiA
MGIKRISRGSGHSYLIDGSPADGVTTLLSLGLAKPALINWAGNTTAGYAIDHWDELAEMPISKRLTVLQKAKYAERDAAARRGTQVHSLAEELVHGREVDVPEALAGHVESYVRFLDKWQPTPLHVETVVANRSVNYCGTLDLIATMRGQCWLLDVKTARSGIYPETALQLAAYAHAEVLLDGEDELPMPTIDRAAGVWVRADGYDVIPLDVGPSVFATFRHVAYVARVMRDVAESWRGESLAAS